MLSVVVPTISGREFSLDRALTAYHETLKGEDYEVIVIKDAPTWPTACNRGYEKANGDVIHFTADDLEPLPGWHVDALKALAERDELPAPAVYDYSPQGRFANAEDGPDGALTHFTRIPIMTRDQYERIGIWPEIVYYADLWVSEKARTIGIETRLIYSYAFVHHWSQVGRVDSSKNLTKAGADLRRLRQEMEA